MARITFIGNFRVDFSSETHHAKSLESLGHEVIKLQETVATREQILEEGLKSNLVVFIHTHGWQTPGQISWIELSNLFKKADVPFITYHLDLWFGLGRQKDLDDIFYKSLHHFFTVDKLMADWLNENTTIKGHYLPAGVYDKECIMMPPQPVGYDIVFTGSRNYHSEYPYRPQLIDFLRKEYGNTFLHVGNDGNVGQQRGMALNEIYADAKITVGDTLNINFDYPYYSSDRFFEAMGRGAFLVYPKIEGFAPDYIDGEHVVYYKHGDLQDMKAKIDYYLAHDEERERIRKNGFELTKSKNTYAQRWQTILETVWTT